jgi:gas vesicle structural protein
MGIQIGNDDDLSLADLLDRALNKGVVLWGEAIISLAGVDLVYVGLKVLVASYDTAERFLGTSRASAKLTKNEGL